MLGRRAPSLGTANLPDTAALQGRWGARTPALGSALRREGCIYFERATSVLNPSPYPLSRLPSLAESVGQAGRGKVAGMGRASACAYTR